MPIVWKNEQKAVSDGCRMITKLCFVGKRIDEYTNVTEDWSALASTAADSRIKVLILIKKNLLVSLYFSEKHFSYFYYYLKYKVFDFEKHEKMSILGQVITAHKDTQNQSCEK